MAKFNESSKRFNNPPKPQFNESSERFRKTPVANTRNNEGAPAFTTEDKIRFVSRLLTSMFNEQKFYGDTSDALLVDAKKLMDSGASKFVANAAIFARKEFHLRSAAHVIAAELSHHLVGRQFARRTIAQVCERPDDMTEIFSYFMSKYSPNKPTKYSVKRPAGRKVYNGKISNSLKKGIADAFVKFDEYQLDKYDYKREMTCKTCGSAVSMVLKKFDKRQGEEPVNYSTGKAPFCPKCNRYIRDVVIKHPFELKDIALLCGVGEHCKTNEQKALLGRLLNGTMKTAQTWQTKMSAAGGSEKAKKESWEELIAKNKLGYMAALRNLRNIIESGAKNLNKACELIADESQVLKSKQLIFRFVTAYDELQKAGIKDSKVYNAIEIAARHSCKNLPNLYGKTLISADDSGSMVQKTITKDSDVRPADIAVLLLSAANYICEEAITSTFNQTFRLYPMDGSKGIIANARSVRIQGGGTDISQPIRYALNNRLFVDRFIILSDNEINDHPDGTIYSRMGRGFTSECQAVLEEYRRKVNPNVWVHAIDMMGYGTQQFKDNKTNIICGWSEKVLEFIHTAESGMGNIVDRIEEYYFK